MKQPAGYSGTPLHKKLGIKPGFVLHLMETPPNYWELIAVPKDSYSLLDQPKKAAADFVHLFCTHWATVEKLGPVAMNTLKRTGQLWVSWPKASASIPTELKRDPIRAYFLKLGLVDVKVAAIDANWSGLKFVYRLKDR